MANRKEKPIMNKATVKKYLDNLLVELEVTKSREAQEKFVGTINFYNKIYDLQEYVEKESRIPYGYGPPSENREGK